LLSLQSGSCPMFLRIRKASQEFSSTPFMDDGLPDNLALVHELLSLVLAV
jgi:hypothetical protein